MSAYTSVSRPQLDGAQVDRLIRYGMEKFEAAEIYVSPSRMARVVRDAARRFGFSLAEMIVDQYFEAHELISWESYARALRGTR